MIATIVLGNGMEVSFDAEDFDREHSMQCGPGLLWTGRISQTAWQPDVRPHTTYAYYQCLPSVQIYMHRLIMGVKYRQLVDHRDGNGLNNTRANLRTASHTQNCANRRKGHAETSSKFKGVTRANSGKWHAQIRSDRKKRHLGTFATEVEAALAYNIAAQQAWGEFAYLNPIEQVTTIDAALAGPYVGQGTEAHFKQRKAKHAISYQN